MPLRKHGGRQLRERRLSLLAAAATAGAVSALALTASSLWGSAGAALDAFTAGPSCHGADMASRVEPIAFREAASARRPTAAAGAAGATHAHPLKPRTALSARGGGDGDRTAWIAVVNVSVTEGDEGTFLQETLENARNSVQEEDNLRFDVMQDKKDNSNFILVEMYRSAQGPVDHKGTDHYNTWRENVADLMARPREAIQYDLIYPSSPSNLQYDAIILERNPPTYFNVNHVFVEVKPGTEQAFIEVSKKYAGFANDEYLTLRCDILQNIEEPTKFLFIEVYRLNSKGVVESDHKLTDYYKDWAKGVSPMMAARRIERKLVNYFPTLAAGWKR